MGAIGLIGLSRLAAVGRHPRCSAAAVVALLVIDPWLAAVVRLRPVHPGDAGAAALRPPVGRGGRPAACPTGCTGWAPALAIPVAAQAMCGPVVVLLQGSVSVDRRARQPARRTAGAAGHRAGRRGGTARGRRGPVARGSWPGRAVLPTTGHRPGGTTAAPTCPVGTLPWPDGPPGAFLLAGLSLALLFSGPWLVARLRRRPVLAGGARAGLTRRGLGPTGSVGWPPPGWRLVACDVGQGDGLVLAHRPGPRRRSSTPAPTRRRSTAACAASASAPSTPLVLTHFHADHVDGAAGGAPRPGGPAAPRQPGPRPPTPGASRSTALGARPRHPGGGRCYAGDRLAWARSPPGAGGPARASPTGSVPNNASVVLDGRHRACRCPAARRRRARGRPRAAARPGPRPGVPARPPLRRAQGGPPRIPTCDDPAGGRRPCAVALISVGAATTTVTRRRATLALLRGGGTAAYRTDQRGDVAVSRDGSSPLRVLTTRGERSRRWPRLPPDPHRTHRAARIRASGVRIRAVPCVRSRWGPLRPGSASWRGCGRSRRARRGWP